MLSLRTTTIRNIIFASLSTARLATADAPLAPLILDAKDLSLVWNDPRGVGSIGLRPQEYNVKTYLKFYASESADSWAGGEGVLLDETYNIAHRMPTLDPGRDGDQHEFALTRDGTALLTQTHTILTDCSVAGGPETECQLLVGGFQAVDVASGRPLFTWDSTELAMSLTESCQPYATTEKSGRGWDFFSSTPCPKTHAGDYLVGGRGVCAVFLVTGKSCTRVC
ncbi:Arylsulfotransferase (ASST) [Microdochium nivale]|nr:Arylsulfotransferase (ASST) [Microdochium nivale]